MVLGDKDHVLLARTGDALHGEFQPAAGKPQGYDATRFAAHADESRRPMARLPPRAPRPGANAWIAVMAPGGALWRKTGRVEGEAVRGVIAALLAKVRSRGDRWRAARAATGATIGTYDFTQAAATAQAATGRLLHDLAPGRRRVASRFRPGQLRY